ncbi:cytochrome c maturation protein CcmE [Sphingomicrobium clamense]|uniref:Cytochrome c-type biogenesis protein CcmE n=1 Tax=Sphingomicrobium clamense TaxID=2851013 RepID=A0ABS6V6Q0_9SPHN|nr:cytochrome c maturation protein CcmE [Sphingomicrobium sp. B8]MBW0145240.1 cytochrome c maturation protein CcmE [Sphingomicrobium sp. B8]
MRPKNQRLLLAMAALLAIAAASGLALWGLQDRAAYFVTPTDIATTDYAPDQPLRLGGMVEQGSIEKLDDGVTTRFTVEDLEHEVVVTFTGIVPDLFREGSGVVAEGRVTRDRNFDADKILAKHDERYMPPELGDLDATQETVAP